MWNCFSFWNCLYEMQEDWEGKLSIYLDRRLFRIRTTQMNKRQADSQQHFLIYMWIASNVMLNKCIRWDFFRCWLMYNLIILISLENNKKMKGKEKKGKKVVLSGLWHRVILRFNGWSSLPTCPQFGSVLFICV